MLRSFLTFIISTIVLLLFENLHKTIVLILIDGQIWTKAHAMPTTYAADIAL